MSDQQQPTVDRPTEADMQVDLRDCLANFGEWFPAVRGPISQAAVERTKAILRRALYAEAILNAPRVMLFADGREPTKNERHLFNLLTWAQHECRKQKEQTLYWMDQCHKASGADEIDRLTQEVALLREGIRDRAGEVLDLGQENRDLVARVKALEAAIAQVLPLLRKRRDSETNRREVTMWTEDSNLAIELLDGV